MYNIEKKVFHKKSLQKFLVTNLYNLVRTLARPPVKTVKHNINYNKLVNLILTNNLETDFSKAIQRKHLCK